MTQVQILIIIFSVLTPVTGTAQFLSIQLPQSSGLSVGRAFPFPGPPQGSQWLDVFETMLRSQDPAWVNSADANICIYGDAAVVQALQRLYHAEGLEQYRDRIVRPLAGLQQESGVREAQKIMLTHEYPPDHPIVTQSALSIMRKLGTDGLLSLLTKLNQWGGLPKEEEIPIWNGNALLRLIAENGSTSPSALKSTFIDQTERNSGARYAAAHALSATADQNIDLVQEFHVMESNPTVRKKLQEIIAGSALEPAQEREESAN